MSLRNLNINENIPIPRASTFIKLALQSKDRRVATTALACIPAIIRASVGEESLANTLKHVGGTSAANYTQVILCVAAFITAYRKQPNNPTLRSSQPSAELSNVPQVIINISDLERSANKNNNDSRSNETSMKPKKKKNNKDFNPSIESSSPETSVEDKTLEKTKL